MSDHETRVQRTLKSSIDCSGVALHSGDPVSMTLHPAEVNTGVVFVRADRKTGERLIPATWDRVVDTTLCTVIGNEHGATIGTIEHLMAALRGCGVDNVVVEVDGPEVPIMDGSAEPFVFLIECAGTVAQPATRRAIRVLRPVHVDDGRRGATLEPAASSSFSLELEFPTQTLARQEGFIRLANGAFKNDLARARTFGFLAEVDDLRRRGLARGGSLDNAIVIHGKDVLNVGGLRYEDELVRHKLLDAIGDLFLAGAPIIGHFHGRRSGHKVNNDLLRALFADDTAWCFDTAASVERGHGGFVPGRNLGVLS